MVGTVGALFGQIMEANQEAVRFHSLGVEVCGTFFTPVPSPNGSLPALVVCHGAGEFKEAYFELCETLASRGVATLAMDMHGHGASGGERYHTEIRQWVADVRAAVDFLQTCPKVDGNRIGAFGLSSGGTAILEAALVDSRLKALVTLDATVRNSLPLSLTCFLRILVWLGKIKKICTGRDLLVPLAKLGGGFHLASDPEIDQRLQSDPRAIAVYMNFPFPGGAESIFVDTLKRAPRIKAPTLILWGEDDTIDPPATAHLLFDALRCEKELRIIPGNGHVGHLDRNRHEVFALTAEWALKKLGVDASAPPASRNPKIIEGAEAQSLRQREKWEMLSPFLKEHGWEALAYPTLQAGMEYFIDDSGYIAYVTARHPVFARTPKKIVLSDPVCARRDYPKIIHHFLSVHPRVVFGCVSEACGRVLHDMGFKVNCLGPEVELPIQTYNTKGNWKELDLIKRARNEGKREGIAIREENIETVNREELARVSGNWIGAKKIHDREIWIYARRPVLEAEPDVRKFVAYDREGHVAGFVFYDPMYRDGKIFGYAANISRCDEERFSGLATAVHMEAMDKFKAEGREILNLCLAPFVKLEQGKFNDDMCSKLLFKLSAKYGNAIYNFRGLAFHKSKYRGNEKYLYSASRSLWPMNDIYLAFLSAGITRGYFDLGGRLLRGVLTIGKNGGNKPTMNKTSRP